MCLHKSAEKTQKTQQSTKKQEPETALCFEQPPHLASAWRRRLAEIQSERQNDKVEATLRVRLLSFHKLIICWHFLGAQPSVGFTEDGTKKRENIQRARVSVEENVLLVPGVKGQSGQTGWRP